MATAVTAPQVAAPKEASAYRLNGFAAINPAALGVVFAASDFAPYGLKDGVAVVDICGPLCYAPSPGCFLTYGFLEATICAALECGDCRGVVLRINSPGGDVAGTFETARAIRAAADSAGKPLIAFAIASCHSAAYALAAACDQIIVADTGSCGSVGVISQLIDETARDSAMGIKVTTITTGDRKADGNPHVPITPGAIEAVSASISALGQVFFGWVESRRPGAMPAASDAKVAVGAAAVAAGLADAVGTYKDACAAALAPLIKTATVAPANATAAVSAIQGSSQMADEDKDKPEKKEDTMRAALVTASESDDPEKAKRAKAALAAYDSDEDPEKDKKDDKASAAAVAVAAAATDSAVQLATTVQKQGAELAAVRAELETSKRVAFLATRPDLSQAVIDSLSGLPFDAVQKVVNAIPKVAGGPARASTAVVAATQGASHGNSIPLAGAGDFRMRAAFGLTSEKIGVAMAEDGVTQLFGVNVAAEAK